MRNQPLSEETRDAIRAVHKADPRIPYREIGRMFKITASCVGNILNDEYYRPKLEVRHAAAPKAPEPLKDSVIRPPSLSRLMAGR